MKEQKLKARRLHVMTQNEIEELKVQKIINKHVDSFNSFRFNAGAGAGKTYALIETLKYVAVNKIVATRSPKKVACITYTNVAVNEINKRLGNSDTVHVSTIHVRLWEIIKKAQPQLLICHKDKIEEVMKQNNNKLNDASNRDVRFFSELNEEQKKEFIDFAVNTKDLFYRYKKMSAKSFKSAYASNSAVDKPIFLNKCLLNVKNFQHVVGLLYKNKSLEECLARIETGEEKRVSYDSKVNSDRLHYMKFSHDTLLEYGLKLVKEYPILCRIIIDSYPYFFIDEFQDTDRNVVKFLKTIHDYAAKHNKEWMVGYFGDTAQCIYDDGVGQNISVLHDGLVSVNKIFNRRSHKQIIDVANNIRADEIVQEPIFDDRINGLVSFYYHNSEDKLAVAKNFLSEYKSDLAKEEKEEGYTDTGNDKIHCLVLTNKLMASFNGFEEVYGVYSKSIIYYNDLNAQVLSRQLEKLHPTVLTIYHLIKIYQYIQKGVVSYYEIFGESSKNMTFCKASLVIRELENKEVTSLRDWVDLIYSRLENSDVKKEIGKAIINRISFELDAVVSGDIFRDKILDDINALMNDNFDEECKAKDKIDSVLDLSITSLINWVEFIDGVESDDMSYHTYHGTKGEEYRNVAIILEHNFGRNNKNKFKNYFKVVQTSAEEREVLLAGQEAEEKHINTQNLLYVACTRAIKNLRVLYLDDISEIENGIKTIFGESRPWPMNEKHISE